MKGYRTIVVNVVALLALGAAALLNIEVNAEDQGLIVGAVLVVINIGLRRITTTPMGEK
jgi:hypothetical protein